MNYHQLLNIINNNGKKVLACSSTSNINRMQETREILSVNLDITGTNIYAYPGIRPIERIMKYLRAEWAWYFSGDRRSELISKHAKLWSEIENTDGTLNSNYGHLVFYNRTPHPSLSNDIYTPFDWAVARLSEDKNTRQAVVTYNTGGFNYTNNKDYICTQFQHFLIRGNELICFIPLRSSDAIFGLTYNIPWWSAVQQLLRISLLNEYPNLKLGAIEVNIHSSHMYEKHYDIINNMLSIEPEEYYIEILDAIPLGKGYDWYNKNIDKFYKLNKCNENS